MANVMNNMIVEKHILTVLESEDKTKVFTLSKDRRKIKCRIIMHKQRKKNSKFQNVYKK